MALGARIGWHARAAWRASRFTVGAAFAAGLLLRLLIPVQDAWLAAAVAAAAAVLALGILALGEARGGPLPPSTMDQDAALERLGAPDLVGLVLARAAMVLGALALGLALGGAMGIERVGDPAAGGQA